MIKAIPLISLLVLAGCASIDVTAPKQTQIESARTYDLDYHSTWVKAVDWFADHNVVIEKIEKESGLLTAKHLLETDNGYIDCGKITPSGTMSDSIEKVGSLNLTVRRVNDKQTKVNVNFFGRFEYVGRDAWDGRIVKYKGNCVSTGKVESSILNYIN